MNTIDTEDKTLILNLKKILKKKYGNLIVSIHCYGSRVTQNKKDGDFDILILTNNKINWRTENEISKHIINYGIQNDIVFDPQFYSRDEFGKKFQALPFVRNIKAVNIVV